MTIKVIPTKIINVGTGLVPVQRQTDGHGCHPYKNKTVYRLNNQLPHRKTTRLKDFDYSLPHAYFITLCTKDKVEYFKDNGFYREIIGCLIHEKEKYGFSIYAYCLMPDHLHILLSPKELGRSIPDFIGAFKSKTTRTAWQRGIRGSLWQSSFYDHILRKDENVKQAAEYIFNNPVRKGMVSQWQEYPYLGMLDEIP